ncbi:hypothetical protein C5O78_09275 [Treponema phagedenis]|nr:hypothetical protein C5O78_09275 [Treponema phagedenis]
MLLKFNFSFQIYHNIEIFSILLFRADRRPSNIVLNRKNGFAQRAKLAQKLRWRKATKSNFCDKVFIGFENRVMCF